MLKKSIILYFVIWLIVASICVLFKYNAEIYLAHSTGLITMFLSSFLFIHSFRISENKISIVTGMAGLLMFAGYFLYIFFKIISSKFPMVSVIFDVATSLSIIGNIYLITLLRKK